MCPVHRFFEIKVFTGDGDEYVLMLIQATDENAARMFAGRLEEKLEWNCSYSDDRILQPH